MFPQNVAVENEVLIVAKRQYGGEAEEKEHTDVGWSTSQGEGCTCVVVANVNWCWLGMFPEQESKYDVEIEVIKERLQKLENNLPRNDDYERENEVSEVIVCLSNRD